MATSRTKAQARIVRHDDGMAVLFEPEILRELGMDENTLLSVTTDGQTLRITPVARYATREEVENAMRQINQEWGDVLKKLAE